MVLRRVVDDLQEGASFYIADGEHRVVLRLKGYKDAATTARLRGPHTGCDR